MRGGLVALGAVFVLVGFSLVVIVQIDGGRLVSQFVGSDISRALWVVCLLPLALIMVGFMVFVAGLIGKSRAELEAMRPYPPPYPPPPPP